MKVGMANLEKAMGFERANNLPQTIHYSNRAATKLKQMKDRPVEAIDKALNLKFDALNLAGRNNKAMECAKEWYLMYPTNHTHPPAILAGFALIESCIQNKEYTDALLYAHTAWETITLSRDSHIPDDKRQWFEAQGARYFAKAQWYFAKAQFNLAQSEGIPAEQ